MELKIKTNEIKFRYDMYVIITLFYPFYNIQFVESNYDFKIDVLEKSLCVEDKDENKKQFLFEDELSIKENIKKIIFKYFTEITGKKLPWGTLVGIRPSKIALSLINEGKSKDEIERFFYDHHLTSKEKTDLCIDVAKVEESFVNTKQDLISVYVGMPFCPTRCLYCSFTSNPIEGCKNLVEEYLRALQHEIEETSKYIKERELKIQCVYFGGGTPTSVNDEQFEKVMKAVYEGYIKEHNVEEFTVECGRPDSITENKLITMKKYGVHRISINPQSMNDKTLKLIGRRHSVEQVIEKFNLARNLHFDNINMDIIIGLMEEGIEEVHKTCEAIRKLNPDSITVHGLSIKRGSRLYESMLNNYKLNPIDQEELNEMYKAPFKLSEELSMKPYYMYRQKNMVGNMENIGYSKEGKECIYNIQMIEEKQSILAVGADAISKVIFLEENRIERAPNVKDVKEYVNRIEEMIEKKLKLFETLYGRS